MAMISRQVSAEATESGSFAADETVNRSKEIGQQKRQHQNRPEWPENTTKEKNRNHEDQEKILDTRRAGWLVVKLKC